MDRGLLDGQVGIVTGAGRGLGRSIALRLAAEGCRVAVVDIDRETADETVELVRQQGGDARAVTADISSEPDVERVVDTVVEQFGTVDIACNNAVGRVVPQRLDDLDGDYAREMVTIALLGTTFCLKHELRAMRHHGGGAIVNISSTAPRRGQEFTSIYSACKEGIEALTRVAANENGSAGIRVNAVAAGGMMTPAMAELLESSPGSRERAEARIPLGHLADPAEVADAALFLCSDMARFITGTVLVADGGGLLHPTAFT